MPALTASSANLSAVSGVTCNDTEIKVCKTLDVRSRSSLKFAALSFWFHWNRVFPLNWPALVWGPACFQQPGRQRSSTPASSEGSSRGWWWRTRCQRDNQYNGQEAIPHCGEYSWVFKCRMKTCADNRKHAQEIEKKSEMHWGYFLTLFCFNSCLCFTSYPAIKATFLTLSVLGISKY